MSIVFKDGRIIDGTGGDPLPRGTAIIDKGITTTVESRALHKDHLCAHIIDTEGKTVLPGFIDCHTHTLGRSYNYEKRLTTPASLTIIRTLRNLKVNLETGVTTVRHAGGWELVIKRAVEQGLIPGPRLYISTMQLTQRGGLFDFHLGSRAKWDLSNMVGHWGDFYGGLEVLRRKVRERLLAGADLIKVFSTGNIYTKPRPSLSISPHAGEGG